MVKCKTCGAPVTLAPDGDPKYVRPCTPDMIPRAEAEAMVAAALREAARIVNRAGHSLDAEILALIPDAGSALDRAVAEAVKAERERCAKLAEGESAGPYFRLPAFHGADGCASDDSDVAQAARAIAAAIRAQNGEG